MTCQSGQPLSEEGRKEGRKAVNATSVGRGRGGITNKERRRWDGMEELAVRGRVRVHMHPSVMHFSCTLYTRKQSSLSRVETEERELKKCKLGKRRR